MPPPRTQGSQTPVPGIIEGADGWVYNGAFAIGTFASEARAQAHAAANGTVALQNRRGQWMTMRADYLKGRMWQWDRSGSAGGSAAPGAAAGAGAGSGAAPAAVSAAAQGGPASMGGGNAGFTIGAVDNQTAMTAWPGEWEGIDSTSPDTRMPASLSPDAVNWNSIERFGSRCVRRGVAKMSDDRDTLTISASPIHADYRGVSLCPLPGQNGSTLKDLLLLCFADNTIGGVPLAQDTSLWLVNNAPQWGQPANLSGYPGPKLTLTEPSPGAIRITYDYTNVWSADQPKITVKSVTIRYNTGAGDITFPIELDTITDDAGPQDPTGRRAGTAAKDRATWDGTSATVDVVVTGGSGTVLYASAWAHGLLGTSARSTAARAIA